MTDAKTMIDSALATAAASLVSAGDWLTAEQRRECWEQVRDARTNDLDRQRREAISPFVVQGEHGPTATLESTAVEVIHRLTSDPGRLTRTWAEQAMNELGEEVYTELVGVAACAAVVDTFSWAMFGVESAIAELDLSREPQQVRPDTVGDVGAWVAQTTENGAANVSRSLSLVPVTNTAWVGLVQALYSRGIEFFDMSWDRALSRPQVELVAARTTAEMECFY